MFQKTITKLLNKYLGSFVKTTNQDQFKVGFWPGDISLEDLELRTDAFDQFGLPITLHYGLLGSLDISIPWKNLGTKPIEIVVDKVLIVTRPVTEHDYDPEREKEKAELHKQKMLEEREERVEEQRKLKNTPPEKRGSGLDFLIGNNLIKKIINNLRITIKNIHIRHETNLNNVPVAIGVTLDSLTIQNNEKFSMNESFFRKLLELNHFSVYWDLGNPEIIKKPNSDPKAILLKNIPRKSKEQSGNLNNLHHYIVHPISGRITATVKQKGWKTGDSLDVPKFMIMAKFDPIKVSLANCQLQLIQKFTNEIAFYNLSQKYLEYRKPKNLPTPRSKHTCKEWWRFLYRSVKADNIKEKGVLDWNLLVTRRLQRDAYIPLWTRKLQLNNRKKWMHSKEKRQLDELEKKIPYNYIVLLRSITEFQYGEDMKSKHINQVKNKNKSTLFDFSRSKKENENKSKQQQEQINDEQISEYIRLQLDQEEISNYNSPPEFKIIEAIVEIPNIEVTLIESKPIDNIKIAKEFETNLIDLGTNLINLNLNAIKSHLVIRKDSQDIDFSINSMNVVNNLRTETKCPYLIQQKNTDQKDFLNLNLNINPSDSKADIKLKFEMNQIEIIYDHFIIMRILNCFSNPNQIDNKEYNDFNQVKNIEKQKTLMTQQGGKNLLDILKTHQTLDIDINIIAPVILIPESLIDLNSSLLIINLGNIKINSDLDQINRIKKIQNEKSKSINKETTMKTTHEEPNNNDLDIYFDHLNIKLCDLNVLLFKNFKEWENNKLNTNNNSSSSANKNILNNLEIILNVKLGIAPNNPYLTNTILSGKLNTFNIDLNTLKIEQLINLMNNVFTLPKEESKLLMGTKNELELNLDQETIIKNKTTLRPEINDNIVADIMKTNKKISKLFIEKKLMVIDFQIKKIVINIADNDPNKNNFFSIILKNFKLHLNQRPYDSEIQLILKEINIIDLYSKKNLPFITTINDNNNGIQKNKNFLMVDMKSIFRFSPEFNNVESIIDCQINDLYINFYRKTINEFISFLALIPKKREVLDDDVSIEEIDVLDQDKQIVNKSKMKEIKSDYNVIKTQLNVTINKIEILLAVDPQVQFCQINLNNLNTKINLFDAHNKIILNLSNLEILNLTAGVKELYPSVFKILGKDPIYVEFLSNTNPNIKWDSKIVAKLSQIELYYLGRFLDDFLNFIAEIGLADDLMNDSKDDDVSELQNNIILKDKAATRPSIMLLDVELNNVFVNLPQNSTSNVKAIAAIDQIKVKNENPTRIIEKNDERRFVHTQFFIVDISNLSLVSGVHQQDAKDMPTVILPCDLIINIEMPVDANEKEIPGFAIYGTFPKIKLICNRKQYEDVLAIAAENFGERSPIPINIERLIEKKKRKKLLLFKNKFQKKGLTLKKKTLSKKKDPKKMQKKNLKKKLN